MRNRLIAAVMTGLAIGATSCVHVHVDPIYAKVDVNIKVDQELDSFFDDVQKKQSGGIKAVPAPPAPAASEPATVPAVNQ